MGPQNGIMGGTQMPDFGTSMPQSTISPEQLAEIAKAAKFSKTKEFQELKEYLEARIDFYSKNLPGGQPVSQVDPAVVAGMWVAADCIIRELNAIITVYESAAQQMKDAKKGEATL